METLLLPESIGDSQPRDRRLPASSLHSATAGRKRRAELMDKWSNEEEGQTGATFRCVHVWEGLRGDAQCRDTPRGHVQGGQHAATRSGSLRHVVTSPV